VLPPRLRGGRGGVLSCSPGSETSARLHSRATRQPAGGDAPEECSVAAGCAIIVALRRTAVAGGQRQGGGRLPNHGLPYQMAS